MAADSRTARRGAVPRQGGGEQERRPVRGKSAPEKKAKEPHRWWIFYWGGSIDIPMLVITLVLLVLPVRDEAGGIRDSRTYRDVRA